MGFTVIAVSDSRGGIINQKGLDVPEVIRHKKVSGQVSGFPGSEQITNADLLECDCDILVPAALSNQLTGKNVNNIKAKIILELANAPTSVEADNMFFDKSVMLIPDILANSGGVVGSYFEWIQNINNDYWEESKVLDRLKKIMITAFHEVYSVCQEDNCTMRKAAYKIVVKRILNAERLRGNL